MAQQLSPYPAPGYVHTVDIVRKRIKQNMGVMSQTNCDETILYKNVASRVSTLRKIDENRENSQSFGLTSANERTVSLRAPYLLNKMTDGDYIRIPWGTRPNVFAPSLAPNNAGPELWIDSPLGKIKLSWDGTKYTDGTVTISENSGGNWCLVHATLTHCFVGSNFTCQQFPNGYKFLKYTGPPIDYRIISMDIQEDDMGRIHHYSAYIELNDREGQQRQ